MSDIVRLVEAAQARAAPIQRLADVVAGKFTYGVMATAAATFLFWATIGTRAFPNVVTPYLTTAASKGAASLLLSFQLACNVLVVACPCALGLAAPTAVLVGTGAAARRGLLVRGGDVLESSSKIDTVVFDKTGTLTAGKPVVVDVRIQKEASGLLKLSRDDIVALAAAVESESTHPLGKAVVAEAVATRGGGIGMDSPVPGGEVAKEGSFLQEPGSGVVATVGSHRVSVGSLEWVHRQIGCVGGATNGGGSPIEGEEEEVGARHV